MANSNQGPPPGPDPGTNTNPNPGINPGPNLPVRDIDLSDPNYASDGVMQQHQATVNVAFLDRLSRLFNNQTDFVATLGYTVNFIGGLPQGYILTTLLENQVDGRVTMVDYFVLGHPGGDSFRSITEFARHVYHIMRNDLVNCDCSHC